jgi:capsular polysaccharide transport system permease protein
MRLIRALLHSADLGRGNGAADQHGVVKLDRPLVHAPVRTVLRQLPATRAHSSEASAVSGPVNGAKPSLRALSFALLVLLPIAVAGAYYFLVASDQFVAEFRFSLSSVEKPRFDPLSLLTGGSPHSAAALESQIVVQYMASRAIVDDLNTTLDLRHVFSTPNADWWARLPVPAPIETLVQYWKGQVDPFYDQATGTVTVRVRAFSSAGALQLAQAMVALSERLVNDLSMRARRDTVRHGETEVAQAEARLQAVLGDIRAFREREGVVDPSEAAKASGVLAARLRDELVRANAELFSLKSYMRDDAPTVRVVKARIRALEIQQRAIARDITDPDKSQTGSLSHLLASYEQLENERRFAETAYQHALLGLDQARADADRQQVYIASFVPPTLPEEALYPRRWRSVGMVALVSFAIWAIGGLMVQSVRDHL